MVSGEAMLGVWDRIAEVARLLLGNPDMTVVRPNGVGSGISPMPGPVAERRTDIGAKPTGDREPADDHHAFLAA